MDQLIKHQTEITILGCGPSTGVPSVTGHWGACDPKNPRNMRTRSSIAFRWLDGEKGEQIWLVDTSPDLRYQCLKNGIEKIDGVLYSHAHFDHIAGLGDLKPFWYAPWRCEKYASTGVLEPLPIYADEDTLQKLTKKNEYAFSPSPLSSGAMTRVGESYGAPPFLKGFSLPQESFYLGDQQVTPFVQDHGYSLSMGFRFGRWAYSTDVCGLDEKAMNLLENLDLWIVDCLDMEKKERPVHAHLDLTLAWIEQVKPKKAILTHMGPQLDYDSLKKRLPSFIEPAFDGMKIIL